MLGAIMRNLKDIGAFPGVIDLRSPSPAQWWRGPARRASGSAWKRLRRGAMKLECHASQELHALTWYRLGLKINRYEV